MNKPTPKADGLRAMREAKFAERGRRQDKTDLLGRMTDASERAAFSAKKAAAKRAGRKQHARD